jgi:hypothetical protein
VTGGDVDEVIGWADRNVGSDETCELGVLAEVAEMHAGDVVLSRIKGSDPTRTDGRPPGGYRHGSACRLAGGMLLCARVPGSPTVAQGTAV